jgi:hypothetical protein
MINTTIHAAVDEFSILLKHLPAQLSAIPETVLSASPAPGKWSKKQIIGHLIDSAANNHQRFVRAQYERVPTIVYEQNKWNALNHYAQAEGKILIGLLCLYNQHLLHLIKQIPDKNLSDICNTGAAEPFTLAFLINDYVSHFKHHLNQILN